MKKQKSGSLIDFIDYVFVSYGEMIPSNGEDSYMFSVDENCGVIGVFDGCGGLGARKYSEYNDKSGAYISSRITSKAALDWLNNLRNGNKIQLSGDAMNGSYDELKERIIFDLEEYKSGARANMVKGSMTKSFPTTLSMILFTNKSDVLQTSYIWAGDSRGFALTTAGLAQMTKDDIETGADALSNISDDGKLTNVVSAEGDFVLNHRNISFKNPVILITATDGCFGYFSTPMEFEFMLLDTMQRSGSVDEWKANLKSYVMEYTGDDYTMCFVVFGYDDFKKMKQLYESRYSLLFEKYINPIRTADEGKKLALWNEYKNGYYRSV